MGAIGLLLAVGLTQALGEERAPPELESFEAPLYPFRALEESVYEGEVEMILDIGADGRVKDFLTLMTTHPEFAEAAERVAGSWVFKPGRVDGKPVRTVKEVKLYFEHGGVVEMNMSPTLTSAWMRSGRADDLPQEYVVAPEELDEPLRTIERVKPGTPPGIPEDRRKGRMVFEFFIDREGRVRMPLLVELEGDERLAANASATLEQWRFAPPLRDGKPVITQARQEFVFHGGK